MPDQDPAAAIRQAWVDESLRFSPDDRGTYVLAAAIAEPAACADIRPVLSGLLLRRQRRLHWRDESQLRRDALLAAVASADLTAVVIVGTPVVSATQERARRLCMGMLMPALEERGVTQVWLEGRTPSLDRADLRMMDALRSARLITPRLRVDTARPGDEPLLLVPDIIAGAVGAARAGGSQRWLQTIRHVVTEITIDLR